MVQREGLLFCLFVLVWTEGEGKTDKRERTKAGGRRQTVGDRWCVQIKRKDGKKE